MKKKTPTFSQKALSFLLIAPTFLQSASAQSLGFGGSIADLNSIFNPPMNIQNQICDTTNSVNVHAYRACSDGVAASRWMAEKYAANAGRYLGCMDGFYQGVWDGYLGGMNPTPEMTADAEAYVRGAKFDSANSRAEKKALAEGQTQSADQIVKRYRSVVGVKDFAGRSVLPNKEYQFPAITFNGFDDGYEHDISTRNQDQIDFTPVIQNGWIKSSSSFDEKIAARRAYLLQTQYSRNLCDMNQTMFNRSSMPTLSIWDYFRARRNYDFQKYLWNNSNLAWTVFNEDEKTLEQYQSFKRLESLEKTITETIPIKESRLKLDANGKPIPVVKPDGTPVLNAAGQPTYQMEEVITGYKTETKTVKLDANEVTALKNLYKQSFMTAYERYYARQYASMNYHREGLDKYALAKIIGQGIGEDVAQHVARRTSYNKAYKAQSAARYAEESRRIYKSNFDRLLDIFENNSVVELKGISILGTTDDEIFTPGESLKARFSVVNLGEMSLPSSISMVSTSDLVSNLGSMEFTPPALAESSFDTPVLGRVSPHASSGDTLQVGIKVKNGGNLQEIASMLEVNKNRTLAIRDYIEVQGVSTSLDLLNGVLSIQSTLINPSTLLSPSTSDIVVKIANNGMTMSKAIEQLPPQSKREVGVQMDGIDPLMIIDSRGLKGTVQSIVLGRVISRNAFDVTVTEDTMSLVVKYFDALATGESRNSGNTSTANRLGELATRINAVLADEVENKIKWTDHDAFKDSIIAEIQKAYQESVIQGTLSSQAQTQYDHLANLLARNVKNIKVKGMFNDQKNKKAFLKELSLFGKSISLKPKDY